jgi:hypothetical protein
MIRIDDFAPLQPLWSFIEPRSRQYLPAEESSGPQALNAPVQAWSLGPGGRPQQRWAVGRNDADV